MPKITFPNLGEVLEIHRDQIARYGGSSGMYDFPSLGKHEGAVAYAGYFEVAARCLEDVLLELPLRGCRDCHEKNNGACPQRPPEKCVRLCRMALAILVRDFPPVAGTQSDLPAVPGILIASMISRRAAFVA